MKEFVNELNKLNDEQLVFLCIFICAILRNRTNQSVKLKNSVN